MEGPRDIEALRILAHEKNPCSVVGRDGVGGGHAFCLVVATGPRIGPMVAQLPAGHRRVRRDVSGVLRLSRTARLGEEEREEREVIAARARRGFQGSSGGMVPTEARTGAIPRQVGVPDQRAMAGGFVPGGVPASRSEKTRGC